MQNTKFFKMETLKMNTQTIHGNHNLQAGRDLTIKPVFNIAISINIFDASAINDELLESKIQEILKTITQIKLNPVLNQ